MTNYGEAIGNLREAMVAMNKAFYGRGMPFATPAAAELKGLSINMTTDSFRHYLGVAQETQRDAIRIFNMQYVDVQHLLPDKSPDEIAAIVSRLKSAHDAICQYDWVKANEELRKSYTIIQTVRGLFHMIEAVHGPHNANTNTARAAVSYIEARILMAIMSPEL